MISKRPGALPLDPAKDKSLEPINLEVWRPCLQRGLGAEPLAFFL